MGRSFTSTYVWLHFPLLRPPLSPFVLYFESHLHCTSYLAQRYTHELTFVDISNTSLVPYSNSNISYYLCFHFALQEGTGETPPAIYKSGVMYRFPLHIVRRAPRLTPTLQTPIKQYYHDRKQSSHPHTIKPSKTELSNKQLTPQNLETAIHSLFHDGLVIVENAIPHDPLDQLNAKMIQDAYTLQARNENSPYNYNPGNIQQDPPPTREYFSKDIFLST